MHPSPSVSTPAPTAQHAAVIWCAHTHHKTQLLHSTPSPLQTPLSPPLITLPSPTTWLPHLCLLLNVHLLDDMPDMPRPITKLNCSILLHPHCKQCNHHCCCPWSHSHHQWYDCHTHTCQLTCAWQSMCAHVPIPIIWHTHTHHKPQLPHSAPFPSQTVQSPLSSPLVTFPLE